MKKDQNDFDVWWYNEGSGMSPLPGEDAEEHVRRICEIAWSNGAYKAKEEISLLTDKTSKTTPSCKIGLKHELPTT